MEEVGATPAVPLELGYWQIGREEGDKIQWRCP